ncbi:MAG: hypothetical protein ABI435_04115 [Pseudolysinimonas sp.]
MTSRNESQQSAGGERRLTASNEDVPDTHETGLVSATWDLKMKPQPARVDDRPIRVEYRSEARGKEPGCLIQPPAGRFPAQRNNAALSVDQGVLDLTVIRPDGGRLCVVEVGVGPKSLKCQSSCGGSRAQDDDALWHVRQLEMSTHQSAQLARGYIVSRDIEN